MWQRHYNLPLPDDEEPGDQEPDDLVGPPAAQANERRRAQWGKDARDNFIQRNF